MNDTRPAIPVVVEDMEILFSILDNADKALSNRGSDRWRTRSRQLENAQVGVEAAKFIVAEVLKVAGERGLLSTKDAA